MNSIRVNFNFALRLGESIVTTGEHDDSGFRAAGHTPEGKNVFVCDGTFAPMEIAEK